MLIPLMNRTPMQITVNGKPRDVPDGTTAAALIDALELSGRRLAMEVNGEIVPKSRHPVHGLAPGDRIEIVHAVGGG
jgi:sulfur carrier protein